MAPILVTGGTGTLGRQVVPLLRAAGREVRVLSRSDRPGEAGLEFVTGDLATGVGVEAAVAGAETVIHCAGGPRGDGDKARHLVRAAAAGVRHLVNISVVGASRLPLTGRVDRVMFGYFDAKLAAERVVAESGLPWTTLRATQFYDSLLLVSERMAKLPVLLLPAGLRFQPVDTGEVAARLADLALDEPAGLVPDLAGPRVYELADLVRTYLRAKGLRRPILPLPLFGKAAGAIRHGALLAGPDGAVGHRTWEDFLADKVASSSGRVPGRV